MKTEVRIITETNRIAFGYWDQEANDGEGDWIEPASKLEIEEAAKKLECSEELLDAISCCIEIIKDTIGTDLITIWKRLDRLENEK